MTPLVIDGNLFRAQSDRDYVFRLDGHLFIHLIHYPRHSDWTGILGLDLSHPTPGILWMGHGHATPGAAVTASIQGLEYRVANELPPDPKLAVYLSAFKAKGFG